MAVSEPDTKKLWGLAAGRCSKPGCPQDCIVFVDQNDPTIVGEMAHVIDKQPHGKRSSSCGGADGAM